MQLQLNKMDSSKKERSRSRENRSSTPSGRKKRSPYDDDDRKSSHRRRRYEKSEYFNSENDSKSRKKLKTVTEEPKEKYENKSNWKNDENNTETTRKEFPPVSPPSNFRDEMSDQNSSFATALEKAKQIAAKLIPPSANIVKLEETAEAKKLAAVNDPFGAQLAAMQQNKAKPLPEVQHTIEMKISGGKVGLVIGKSGVTIRTLQEQTGAKMVVIQDGPETSPEKILKITGNREKCESARQLVLNLITEKEVEPAKPTFNREYGYATPYASKNVTVPRQVVGLIIGKGGDMIRKIQQDSGAKVRIQQDNGPGEQICVITGTAEQMQKAEAIINELINSALQNANKQEVQYSVPVNKCGLIIGKGGETIRQINQLSGARVELSRVPESNPDEKVFVIRGDQQQIASAKQTINEILEGRRLEIPPQQSQSYDSTSVDTWAAYYAQMNYYQAMQQQQAVAGQGDYNAWAEYYRSMGMSKEAEAVEQQIQVQQQQQTDYRASWVEYYKSMGMFKEAEMIEQQIRESGVQSEHLQESEQSEKETNK